MPPRPRAIRPAVALLAAAVLVIPLVVMALGALHAPGSTPPKGTGLFPGDPSTAAFEKAFDVVALERQLVNSLIVAAIAVPLSVLFASLSGFAMALLTGRVRSFVVGLTLISLTIPLSALWVPRFAIWRELGVLDTYVPLIAPALVGTTPLLVLLCFWSARRIPGELIEAARLEGLGPLRLWRRIGIPLTRPTLFAVGALAFAINWSSFVEPLLYLFSPDRATLPLGLSSLRQLGPTDVSVLLAASLIATLPPVLAFALAQRRFLNDTRGAGWTGG